MLRKNAQLCSKMYQCLGEEYRVCWKGPNMNVLATFVMNEATTEARLPQGWPVTTSQHKTT
jgi:hypothetical protein